jgi:hypothetical protein
VKVRKYETGHPDNPPPEAEERRILVIDYDKQKFGALK